MTKPHPASRLRSRIPAFLSFDVEPDGFQLTRGEAPGWDGYDAMFEFAEGLRSALTARSGAAPTFGWYFRTDPQIAEVYGRADHVLASYPDRMARLTSEGDYFGVHAHPIRWCEERHLWIHDFADPAWLAHCTRFSLDAFARWARTPAQRTRWGAGLLTNEIVEATHQCGVKVDLTLEPVAGWGINASEVPTSIDTSPLVGPYTDCSTAPHVPFHPAYHDFRIAGGKQGRSLLMVPLSTAPLRLQSPLWRRAARRLLRGSDGARSKVQVLYPGLEWPSERFFWDLVARQLRTMRRPYLSLAIRTDADDLKIAARVRRLFEALPGHPLAERLHFVDPLDVAHSLV
jgi:hypothetical protein